MSIISKIFFLILFIISFLNSASANQNTINNCDKFSHIDKDIKIKKINIEIKNNKKWQVNNIRILTNNSHVIPDKFKKKFKAKLFVTFENNISCNYEAKIRTHGDLKDHIIIETKLSSKINDAHRQQLKNYLKSAPLNSHEVIKKIKQGLLLNFKKAEKYKDGVNEIPDDKIDIEVWN